jgi:hypothetical protein
MAVLKVSPELQVDPAELAQHGGVARPPLREVREQLEREVDLGAAAGTRGSRTCRAPRLSARCAAPLRLYMVGCTL